MKFDFKKTISNFLCRMGSHDWSDGPGENCVNCGIEDWFWTTCPHCGTLCHGKSIYCLPPIKQNRNK